MFILNRMPTKALKGKTPFEAWHGGKPNVSFLRTFGYVGHVKNTKPHLGKLEDRSTPMVLLGYEEGTKVYRLYDPKGGKLVISRDVVFDEMAVWDWEGPGTGETDSLSNTFVVEHLVIHGGGDAGEEVPTTPGVAPSGPAAMPTTPEGVPSTSAAVPSAPAVEPTTPGVVPTTPAVVPSGPAAMPTTPAEQGGHGPPIEFTSPPIDIDEYVDAFHDSEEVRFRRVDNIVGEGGAPRLASRFFDDPELLLVSAEEPPTFAVAERDDN